MRIILVVNFVVNVRSLYLIYRNKYEYGSIKVVELIELMVYEI